MKPVICGRTREQRQCRLNYLAHQKAGCIFRDTGLNDPSVSRRGNRGQVLLDHPPTPPTPAITPPPPTPPHTTTPPPHPGSARRGSRLTYNHKRPSRGDENQFVTAQTILLANRVQHTARYHLAVVDVCPLWITNRRTPTRRSSVLVFLPDLLLVVPVRGDDPKRHDDLTFRNAPLQGKRLGSPVRRLGLLV